MNTIKKAPLMAFVLGLGLMLGVATMSSFTNSKKVGEIVYLLNSSNTTYTRYSTNGTFPPGSCVSAANFKPCNQRFNTANDPGVTTFPATSIPASNIPGTPNAYWQSL